MKKSMSTLLFLGLFYLSMGQVTLTAQLPSSGVIQKEQLWNLLIVNNGNDIAILKLQMDVRDNIFGQQIISANTGKILVGKGMKLITLNDIQPITYTIMSTPLSSNYLPCGNYSINYRLIQETAKGDEPVAEELVRLDIGVLSGPMLTTPADKSSIDNPYPHFTWMEPTPIQMFSPLFYELTVVGMEDGQTAFEAISANRPVYNKSFISATSEVIPSSFTQLQAGKSYAWQIVAQNGSSCAVPSEVWMFTIGKDSIAKIVDQAPFIKLSKSNTEVTVMHQGFIKMEYHNAAGDKNLKFTIYEATEREKNKRNNIQFEVPVTEGQNFIQYDLIRKGKLNEKTVYEVSMINSRGEEWLMRFVPVYYRK